MTSSFQQFLLVDRRAKIESGQRTTSFSFLLNDKHGLIGRLLSYIPPGYREVSFMGGQLGGYFSRFQVDTALYTAMASLRSPDRASCCLLAIRQLAVEWCFYHPDIRGQRLERRRLLH